MTKEDYNRLKTGFEDPYSLWIREKEIKREKKDLVIPGNCCLFLDDGGYADPGLMSALQDYQVFNGGYDFIYTDEDEVDGEGLRHDPFFKPDYSPDTLESFYYPGALTIVSNALAEETGRVCGFAVGSPEFLRECGKRAKKPLHIPEVLCHAYSHRDYLYENTGNREETGLNDAVISVVILSKDHPKLAETCVKGLLSAAEAEGIKTECLIIDNGSTGENTAEYERLAEELSFRYVREKRDFIYSALCNKGAEITDGEFLLFLNDDIEVPEGTYFLKEMMGHAAGKRTGAVGIKLLYPGGKLIQHCGITLLKSGASHKLTGYDDSREYYRGVNRRRINVFAVTGACLMVERKKFLEAGGFDETFHIAYTDVDLCSSLLLKGYYNVCLNDVYLIHHESLSRRSDKDEREKYLRLKGERERYYEKYGELIKRGDPWYSRNLTDTGLDYRVNYPSPEDRVSLVTALSECEVSETGRYVTVKRAGETIKLKKDRRDGRVLFSLDTLEKKLSDAAGNEDFLEISGWGFVHGRAGYEYGISLLIKDGDRQYYTETMRVPREDLITVFPSERDILFSGFSVKIKNSLFNGYITRENVTILLMKKNIFGHYGGFAAG